MQQEKRIFDVTRLEKDMQLKILMNIPNPEQYFSDYQSRFSNLSAIIGQEDTIKLSILFYGEGSIPKPMRDTKGKQINYSGRNIFNKISRYLGQELAEQLEKASKEGESLKYVSVIYLPDAEDLFKQITEQDYYNLIFQDWEEFTKTDEYQEERYDDDFWSAEVRPVVGWAYWASQRYNIERKQLIRMIRERFNI